MDYWQLLADVPLPTRRQTVRFAAHLAEAHSWYKHLPFFPPGASFVFFLNPHACMGLNYIDDAFTVFEVKTADYCDHPSRLATTEYLCRFGYWDYWIADIPGYREHQAPRIYGLGEGGSLTLPDEVAQHWSCCLTAFLKDGPVLKGWQFDTDRAAFRKYARENPREPEVARYARLARRARAGETLERTFLVQLLPSETAVQRDYVLRTLNRVREECAAIKQVRA